MLTEQREVSRRISLGWGGVGECFPSSLPSLPPFFPALSDFVPHSPLSARLEESREYSNLRSFKPRFKIDQVVCYGPIFQELNRRRGSCLSSLFSLGRHKIEMPQ